MATLPREAAEPRTDLPQTVLAVLFLCLLLFATARVVQPFLGALVWAAMYVVATWPLLLGLERWMGGRRRPAIAVLVLALLMLLVVPLSLGIGAIVTHLDEIATWPDRLRSLALPPPPAWISALPVAGETADRLWREAATGQFAELTAKVAPYATIVATWFAGQVGTAGALLVHFLLTVVLAAILFANGETAADGVLRFCRRLGGEAAADVAVLGAQAIRGVALGVVGTALVQSALGAIGLAIAGVPFAPLLGGVMLLLCIAQVGPLPVLLPAVAAVYWQGQPAWGTFLLVWSLVVGTVDNVLRPILIRRGANLPILLILAGVLGGLVAFGLVGIFVGPVVLAVAYTLAKAWIAGAEVPR